MICLISILTSFLIAGVHSQVVLLSNNNFCAVSFPQLSKSDGSQNRQGTCSSTVQGAIPSTQNMVSTIIISPKSGSNVARTSAITITVSTRNLQLGSFSDPNSQYYLQPQSLNANGIIIGHQHVVVQFLGNPNAAPDAQQFDFFKGLDGQPDESNQLSVIMPPNTLKNTGQYRICSITGATTHQPVIMPVAQRGSQDDCVRVNAVANAEQVKAAVSPILDQNNTEPLANNQENNAPILADKEGSSQNDTTEDRRRQTKRNRRRQ